MSSSRRTIDAARLVERHGLGGLVEPFSARSVIASTLLGTYPPRLQGRLLVALAERFDIAPGTTRVALSRMLTAGELVADDGHYMLQGRLAERQQRQDAGRRPPSASWDGTWEQAIITVSGRSSNERVHTRRLLQALIFGELREGVWLRPANLSYDRLPSTRAELTKSVTWFTAGPIDEESAAELAASIFDLSGWASLASKVIDAADEAVIGLERTAGESGMVAGFTVAAAALRHLVHDPQLPIQLQPSGWPSGQLRSAHQQLDTTLSVVLREFFASHRKSSE